MCDLGAFSCLLSTASIPNLPTRLQNGVQRKAQAVSSSLTHCVNMPILKGEKICSDRKICDCIIFVNQNNTLIVGIIELKSKHIDASGIKEQLTNGSKSALKILEKCPDTYNKSEFYPIVLAKGWGRTSRSAMLRNTKIQFGSKERRIITKKCGDSFLEIISQLK